IKPAMIAEATASAREAAQQFARDANASVGGLRRANQGVFQILARDQAPGVSEQQQPVKTVRVVSTVDYYLE
ncbi:MAG: SIMPL domain-containing protein, partial [Marinobacter sp.]|nr:SIMPL domain-containing protein [Marinobacter sp.]MDX5387706.1 SIMPL domain-containing protein [Marinobacter sp.]MDX5473012.1 SIMPL domain-containing protein [Marinobacter sp.]